MDLTEWTVSYVKHKDLLQKKLEGFEEKEGLVSFRFKDRTHDYIISEKLNPEFHSDADAVTLVCLNNEDNFNVLMKNWKGLVKSGATIILAKPANNTKWIIRPQVHDKIADPDNLEEGLRSMFEASE